MAFILTDTNEVSLGKNKDACGAYFKRITVCKVTAMLSRVPAIFLYSFIIRSTNCYKIARAAITALHVKDGFNYVHNIYANTR